MLFERKNIQLYAKNRSPICSVKPFVVCLPGFGWAISVTLNLNGGTWSTAPSGVDPTANYTFTVATSQLKTIDSYYWQKISVTWNSGNNYTATISIRDFCTEAQGDDFAIDDIQVTAQNQPLTYTVTRRDNFSAGSIAIYTVTLKVTDGNGCESNQAEKSVSVSMDDAITITGGVTQGQATCVNNLTPPHQITPSVMPTVKDACGNELTFVGNPVVLHSRRLPRQICIASGV